MTGLQSTLDLGPKSTSARKSKTILKVHFALGNMFLILVKSVFLTLGKYFLIFIGQYPVVQSGQGPRPTAACCRDHKLSPWGNTAPTMMLNINPIQKYKSVLLPPLKRCANCLFKVVYELTQILVRRTQSFPNTNRSIY